MGYCQQLGGTVPGATADVIINFGSVLILGSRAVHSVSLGPGIGTLTVLDSVVNRFLPKSQYI